MTEYKDTKPKQCPVCQKTLLKTESTGMGDTRIAMYACGHMLSEMPHAEKGFYESKWVAFDIHP